MNQISNIASGKAGSSPVLPPTSKAASTRAAGAIEEDNGSARVTLSATGRGLAALPDLMLPNPVTVRQLATDLARMAGKIFREANVPSTPPVEFTTDGGGRIHVGGDRADKAKIESLLAENPELERAVRDLNAISSHAHAIHTQGHLEFSAEYQASDNPQAVVAKYSRLFSGGMRNDVRTVLDGERVDVVGNGQRWITSDA